MARRPEHPYFDAPITPAVVVAIQALYEGRADFDQQKRALDWILVHVCRVGGSCFVPGDPYATTFYEGRRQAGIIINNTIRSTVELAEKREELRRKGEAT